MVPQVEAETAISRRENAPSHLRSRVAVLAQPMFTPASNNSSNIIHRQECNSLTFLQHSPWSTLFGRAILSST